MSTSQTQEQFSHEEWGDGRVVTHWNEGGWIMYDPDADTVDVTEMR